MRRVGIVTASVFALALLGVGSYLVAFYTVDPDFSVTVSKQAVGDYRLEIRPNFVVNSVYPVEVIGPSGTLVKRDEPTPGVQHVLVPASVPAGTPLTVKCGLQYDRIAPSITSREHRVVVP